MNISVISLTSHRIDRLFSEYIATALNIKAGLYENTDYLIVTNGMYASANPSVLQKMKEVPSLYLIDDHTCWVPEITAYPQCKILCQFTKHPTSDVPMTYFQVSKLALFDDMFYELRHQKPIGNGWIYWGQYKEERHEEYKQLEVDTTVIGRRYPTELSDRWIMLEFDKDMHSLHTRLRDHASDGYTRSRVFGDSIHNGVNLPYRIYEALMCGLIPVISDELLGNQVLDINWILERLSGKISGRKYLEALIAKRDNITAELISYIPSSPLNEASKVINKEKATDEIPLCTDSVEAILIQRGNIYGSYEDGVTCRADILVALQDKHFSVNNTYLPINVQVVFSDIILKLMRAASDPTHVDSWLDLAGYSKLINKMLEENPDVFNS